MSGVVLVRSLNGMTPTASVDRQYAEWGTVARTRRGRVLFVQMSPGPLTSLSRAGGGRIKRYRDFCVEKAIGSFAVYNIYSLRANAQKELWRYSEAHRRGLTDTLHRAVLCNQLREKHYSQVIACWGDPAGLNDATRTQQACVRSRIGDIRELLRTHAKDVCYRFAVPDGTRTEHPIKIPQRSGSFSVVPMWNRPVTSWSHTATPKAVK